MGNVSVGFNTEIIGLDTTAVPNVYVVNRLRDFLYSANSCFYTAFFQVGNRPTPVPLHSTILRALWIVNLSDDDTISVFYTPLGEATQAGVQLAPGGVFFFLNPNSDVGGITALSLSASAVGTACELLCAGTSTVTTLPAPANIYPIFGDAQNTPPNTMFPMALGAMVTDATGNPIEGVEVIFHAPTSGASGTFVTTGLPTAPALTSQYGVATAPTFTANGIQGVYSVTASVSGVALSTSFILTNSSGTWVVTTLVPVLGSTPQTTIPGTSFANPLAVTVLDQYNAIISGVNVTFTVIPGIGGAGGSFPGGQTTVTVASDLTGVATAPLFTANSTTGNYIVTASA